MDVIITESELRKAGFTTVVNWRRLLGEERLNGTLVQTLLQLIPPLCEDGQWGVELVEQIGGAESIVSLPRTVSTMREVYALLELLVAVDAGGHPLMEPSLAQPVVVDCPEGRE